MKKYTLLIIALLFAGFTFASAQATLKSYGQSPRDADSSATDIFDVAYNGLSTVGIGTQMYFVGSDTLALTGASWLVDTAPATSTAAITVTADLDNMNQAAVFTPDLEGEYVVIFSHNGSSDTLNIVAGTYLGISNANGCGCHGDIVSKWEVTGHADMFVRGLDGTLSSHYGEGCISCHTTGFDPNADNDGFDDFGFAYPDSATLVSWGSTDGHLFDGAYDKAVTEFPDAMKRANIQCESCHGPASAHIASTDKENDPQISVDINTDNCALCHDSGTHHAFPDQWEYSGKDATEFDGRGFHGGHAAGAFVSYAGGRGSCAPCHSGSGYIQWVKEGKPTNSSGLPTGTLVLPKAVNISCAVCHDPHDNTKLHQLRLSDTQLGDGTPVTFADYGTGAQCMECHRSRRVAATYAADTSNASSHYGPHHGPQADMLIGKNAPDFGIELPSSPHAAATKNACVDCHMAGDLVDADGNVNHVGGHSFNMNDAEGNDHVESCAQSGCHGPIGTSFKDKKYYINGNADLDGNGTAEGLQLEVKGMMDKLALLLPPVNDADVSMSQTGNLTPEIMKAGYAWTWVYEDRSMGIHNPAFTVALLKAGIEELGGVTAIDYPKNGMPQEYQLSQNYPNPFNPTTKIDFVLAGAGHVQIEVYNVLGQKIATLINEERVAGPHTVDFDASDLSSGLYFYKIQVKSSNAVQYQAFNKMILMK
jgi:hypothetical protein